MSAQLYRKVINVAGPGFKDIIQIRGELHEMEPRIVEVDGLRFERYGDDDEYDEVRIDYIVSRALHPIKTRSDEDPAREEL